MTSPEWEAANEDDSDRFPQPSPHVAPPPLVDPLQSDPARVARYAEAIDNLTFASRPTNADWLDEVTGAVGAVADEERAALVAELLDAEVNGEVSWRRLQREWKKDHDALTARAEAAEAKVARVEALADEWAADAERLQEFADKHQGFYQGVVSTRRNCRDHLRAALADAPAEQRAEGGA